MRIAITLAIASTALLSHVFGQSPFYYHGNQEPVSEYAISGKMEQIGRTGVAAMHAVLLK